MDATDADGGKAPRPWQRRTIASLRLNTEAAMAGKTWQLLPAGFRDQASGRTYPLPTQLHELQELSLIPVGKGLLNAGCVYLRRCRRQFTRRRLSLNSSGADTSRQDYLIAERQKNLGRHMRQAVSDAQAAVAQVRKEAEKAIANLNDLFALGRQGLDAQMRAHLEGNEWKGETINAAAFRECFRLVTQAVKGLGVPSGQRQAAEQTVLEEVARSIRDTQDTIALAPGPESEQ